MSNVTDQHPWVLDTAGVISTDDYYISKLAWVGGTTAGDNLIVHDKNGNVVFESVAAGANHIDELNFSGELLNSRLFHGFDLETISSGKLYVYFA